MQEVERYVAVADVSAEQAPSTLQGAGDLNVPKPVSFNEYRGSYFRAEYTPEGRDITIHFFVSEELKTAWSLDSIESWWLNDFAASLSAVAQEHFQATIPRIMAKYTQELASWWFKAQGYDFLLDRAAYLNVFFELLDGSIHSSLHPQAASPEGTV